MTTWLDDHLDSFVKPYLNGLPNGNLAHNYYSAQFNDKRVIAMVAIWQHTKRKAAGRTILLPGRDVFLFEVIAGMFGDTRVFRPEISSIVAPFIADDYSEHFCLDTGYKGSVPKALGMTHWGLVLYDCSSGGAGDNKINRPLRQIFPTCSKEPYGSLSSNLEGCPKYWTSAVMQQAPYVKGGAIVQKLDPTYFPAAALLTMHVAGLVDKLFPRNVKRRVSVPVRRTINPDAPWRLL